MKKYTELLQNIKHLSSIIRETKPQRKFDVHFNGVRTLDPYQAASYVRLTSRKLRHLHIAYSLLLGNTYEQIEQNVRENNQPDWTLISSIIEKYQNQENKNE